MILLKLYLSPGWARSRMIDMTENATLRFEKPRYQEVADQVRGLIDARTLKPGDKIPSVRTMSRQQQVSISTVLEAYRRLEDCGLIAARPQSGYYVRRTLTEPLPEPKHRVTGTAPTEVTVSDRIGAVFTEASNPDFVQLGAATLHLDLLPLRALGRITARKVKEDSGAAFDYDFPPGFAPLREQIAKRGMDSGCAFSPADILLTSGGSEALRLCLEAVTEPGDVVGVEAPTYYWFLELLDALRLKAVEIPTHPREGVEMEPLERLVREREVDVLLLVPTASNPLGATLTNPKKKAIAMLASEYSVPVIEDDVWGELTYGPFRTRTIKSYDREGWVLLCSSFSKTLQPGGRLGWAAPGRFFQRVQKMKVAATLCNPTLPAMVIAEFLGNGGYDRYIRRIRRKLRDQVQRFSMAISEHFPEGTRMTRPSGGCVLWVELPERVDARILHDRAAEREISIVPGDIFSPTGRFTHFTRINCGQEWTAKVEVALETLGRLAKEMAHS
jgi:DNA-binding transcriptional MocR family regulator